MFWAVTIGLKKEKCRKMKNSKRIIRKITSKPNHC